MTSATFVKYMGRLCVVCFRRSDMWTIRLVGCFHLIDVHKSLLKEWQ